MHVSSEERGPNHVVSFAANELANHRYAASYAVHAGPSTQDDVIESGGSHPIEFDNHEGALVWGRDKALKWLKLNDPVQK